MSAGISRRWMRWKMVSSLIVCLPSGHFAARTERVRERTAVDVFELSTQRDAVGQATRPHAVSARELRQVMRGRLAFDGGIGGDDQFLHFAFAQALVELVQPEFARADAV